VSGSSVLFVHGAHFSGWCWSPVIERLDRHGVPSTAVELPFEGFASDVQYLRNEIAARKKHGRVTVVCTSYSGITATAAAHSADHIMYVAARMPKANESQAALSPTWGNPAFRVCMQPDEEGVMHLTAEANTYLFNRSPESLAALAMAYRRPMRSEIPAEPIVDPAWMDIPSSYVVCLDDQAVRVDRQRERAALATWSIEIDADHSPFFSAPDALANFIAETHEKACA
jgi:pimeloyl-ACP methyl ester carboxylesterase